MTLRIPAKVLIHVWSYDFYGMTLSTGKQRRHMIIILIKCLAFAASFVKVHYPKLYNMAHLLALNVLLPPRI